MKEYIRILKKFTPIYTEDNIEVQTITDEVVISNHNNKLRQQLKKGEISKSEYKSKIVGVISKDAYIIHTRDLVIMRNVKGDEYIGQYNRFIYPNELNNNGGIAVLPIDQNRKLICNITFRHSQECWCCEIGGTISKKGEKVEDSIQRLIDEEYGAKILEIHLLTNHFVAERGLIYGGVRIFLVKLVTDETSNNIRNMYHVHISVDDFLELLKSDQAEIHGHVCRVTDSYALGAVLLAQARGFL